GADTDPTARTLTIDVSQTATLTGRAFQDDNSDGIRQSTEVGVAGVTVYLYNSSNVLIATTTTNSTGNYSFTVLAGDYYAAFSRPTWYSAYSPEYQGTDTMVDSDVDSAGIT